MAILKKHLGVAIEIDTTSTRNHINAWEVVNDLRIQVLAVRSQIG